MFGHFLTILLVFQRMILSYFLNHLAGIREEALSVRGSVRRSVRGSGVSQISRKSRLWDNKTSGNNEFKLIQLNSIKFKQIQENSFILTYIGRIFVRIELVCFEVTVFPRYTTVWWSLELTNSYHPTWVSHN